MDFAVVSDMRDLKIVAAVKSERYFGGNIIGGKARCGSHHKWSNRITHALLIATQERLLTEPEDQKRMHPYR